ncbi:MAG: penicillin-binding protein 2 [Nitrospirae bacterium]|nr:penicillin-binding protein 2 [Nitrospirota bacterium]
MDNRKLVVYGMIFFGFFALVSRLADLMILKHEKFARKSETQRTAIKEIQVRRGLIFDRQGRRLAINLENNSVFLDKANFMADSDKVQQMARIVNVNYNDLMKTINRSKNFTWIKRKIPVEQGEQLTRLNMPGVGLVPEAKRYYTMGTFASHVIGFVDIDNKGLEGVEGRYNKELIEKGGKYYVEKDARGNIFFTEKENEKTGNSIALTLDGGLQYIVENELDEAMSKWKAAAAAAIMMNPYTGEILALANRPTYNPNEPSKYGAAARRNRAITDVYEPGSTFKIVTTSAVLEEKLVKPDEKIDCAGGIDVGGKRIHDVHPNGVLTFMGIIQKSSNVGTAKLAQRLGKVKLYNYVKHFGFGDKTGIDIPGEVSGWIRKPEKWSGTSIGAIPIGQEVATTPLQIVTAYSMLANGGYHICPYVVKGLITPGGDIVNPHEIDESKKERILSRRTVDIMTEALVMVTEEGGTAKFAEVEGNKVAGKTGTAQIFDKALGRYSSVNYISSFVGFVPAQNPAFAMIVVVWNPRGAIYGGVVAGPVFKNIAEKALSYMNVPKDDIKKKILVVDNNKSLSHHGRTD